MTAYAIDRMQPFPADPFAEHAEGHLATRAREKGLVRTSIETVLASYVMLAALMIGLGLLVTQLVVGGAIGRWDDSVVRWMSVHRSSGWTHLASNLSRMADTAAIVALVLLVTVVLAIRRHWTKMLVLAIGLPLELAVFLTANFVVDRPRPTVPRLGSLPSTSSFPSGHVAAAIVVYGGIMVLLSRGGRDRRALVIAGWTLVGLFAIGVAWARLYEGMHHPTDVLAGALYGSCCLAIAALVATMCADARRRDAVAPLPHSIASAEVAS